MTAVLYLDVYFAVNFFMDFLLLLLVRKLLGICSGKTGKWLQDGLCGWQQQPVWERSGPVQRQ